MRLEWLEDILAVAQTGSLIQAAERRRLTQSAFSRRIRQIEDQIGVELFDRTHKPVKLSPTTARQRDQIEFLAGQLRQLASDLRHGAQTQSGYITIVGQHALTAARVPAIIKDTLDENPNAFVRLRSANLDDCLTLLLSRQADMAVLYRLPGTDHPVRPDFVETAVIGTDRLIPVIATRRTDWLDLQLAQKDLPCVIYPPEVFMGQVLERMILSYLRLNLGIKIKSETALTFAALEMALEGFAVAWVPQSVCAERISEGSLVDLSYRLRCCEMDVTAVRLAGAREVGLAQLVWSQIVPHGIR